MKKLRTPSCLPEARRRVKAARNFAESPSPRRKQSLHYQQSPFVLSERMNQASAESSRPVVGIKE